MAVVSQTCDASQGSRPNIQVAPIVELQGRDQQEASTGKRPRFVPLPQLGESFFADLDVITTVVKTALVGYLRRAGVVSDDEVRKFAFAVSRKFGRFAYPDEVVRALAPVRDVLQTKARKLNTPVGKLLTAVHSFRVSCEDWEKTPYELTLIVITGPGVVPSEVDDIGAPPVGLAEPDPRTPLKPQVNAYVDYLTEGSRTPTETFFGWEYLITAWALQCEEAARGLADPAVIETVMSDLASVDDFPLARVLDSESLDLDYLSESRKASD
ncbi:hypothetical protein HH308_11140 [Gordonia sp. TBRC 11910]|uniref:Uncharacterized protein n=1 Tax=Gordonia asplenii TaxID=2725283 RepID=A0A848L290_9ACTN|nr:hypothetical protein [Gordonia asplenii]NMO01768.1 hypothetical protein [Gordonia asplenii]